MRFRFEIGKVYELTPNIKYEVVNRDETTVTLIEIYKGKKNKEKIYPIQTEQDYEFVETPFWKQDDSYYELYAYKTVEFVNQLLKERGMGYV